MSARLFGDVHCPLCAEPQHSGPCYAELREQWKRQDAEKFLGTLKLNTLECGNGGISIAYTIETKSK